MYLSRQAGKFVFSLISVLRFVSERVGGGGDEVVGGGYLSGEDARGGRGGADVEVHGEDECGELGGVGAGPERGGDGLGHVVGLGGGVGLGSSGGLGGGGRVVTIRDLSKLTLFCLLIPGYLSGEDMSFIRVTGKFVSFSLRVLKFVFLGDGGG